MEAKTARILDGKALAQKIQSELSDRVRSLQAEKGRPPGLAVLMVGDNPASAAYVRNKERACAKVGIASFGQHYPANATQTELELAIKALNEDDRVDGILVQLPLPEHLDAISLLYQIAPDKDADGLHPVNLGRLMRGESGLRSCTPAGVMRLLQEYQIDLKGKNAVVLGRNRFGFFDGKGFGRIFAKHQMQIGDHPQGDGHGDGMRHPRCDGRGHHAFKHGFEHVRER